jgi:hypothetical protein
VPSYHHPEAAAAPVEEQVEAPARSLWGYATNPRYLAEQS